MGDLSGGTAARVGITAAAATAAAAAAIASIEKAASMLTFFVTFSITLFYDLFPSHHYMAC